MMRHFYLIKNPEKAGADRVAREICRYIESRGGTCMVREKDGAEETSPASETVGMWETGPASETAGMWETGPASESVRMWETSPASESAGMRETSPALEAVGMSKTSQASAPDGTQEPSQVSEPARIWETGQTRKPAARTPEPSQTPETPPLPDPLSVCSPHPQFQYTDAHRVPLDTECVITLGGDGTLIQAARDLAGRQIPMVGVNLGNLGYLTQIGRQEDVEGLLDALLDGQYQLERRMMLKGSIFRKEILVKEDLALNEVVITRRETLRVLKFRIYVNGEYLSQYRADGMIAATPTGSTAYNLSAGGPIVEPNARMVILTPICPHDLNGRSIVLSAQDVVEIEVLGNDDAGQVAVFDGDQAVYMKVGDRIRIARSDIETILVKLKNISFLDNLRSKLTGI